MAAIKDSKNAVNALTYSYAALTTGAQVVGQQALWTDQRIRSTVDRKYVSSHLKDADRSRLDQPLAFGGGLTDDTYLDFILDRAQKLYLSLCEVGKSEKIFRAIDLSYDDGDLPLPPDTVVKLDLAAKGDDKINRRFQSIQHRYLLRELEEGDHINYLPEETVPLEYVYKAAATHSLQSWIRVRAPHQPGTLMARRRLVTAPVEDPDAIPMDFFDDLDAATAIDHDHIVRIWASYTADGAGYVVSPFVAEYTLKSFLEAKYPPQFEQLSKPDRQRLLLKWLHCLADALTYLHSQGFQHTSITPSNIVVDGANQIAFSDIGSLKSFQQDKAADHTEAYDYSSPEANSVSRTPYIIASAAPAKASLGSRLFRRKTANSATASDESLPDGEYTTSPTSYHSSQNMFQGRYVSDAPASGHVSPSRSGSTAHPSVLSDTSRIEKGDVFSLGCIFVNILAHMHKLRFSDVPKRIKSTKTALKGQKLSGARHDTSFHANLPRVNALLDTLEDIAFENDHTCFRAVPQIIHIVRAMLCSDPSMRPSARSIRDNMAEILIQYAKIRREDLHCEHLPEEFDKHTSYSTNPLSTAPSFLPSPGARSSAYTSSSQYASTQYSGASVRAVGLPPRVSSKLAPPSEYTKVSPPLPWGTFPTNMV